MNIEFREWPKISRLNRDVVITEKIDGTNAAIGIVEAEPDASGGPGYVVYAQSRTRVITQQDDNMGFARWVEKNRDVLIETLGPGLHFGEWWGVGIQRGYDLTERRFSLFNTAKWGDGPGASALARARERGVAIYSVPVLYSGPWTGVFGYHDPEATAEAAQTQWLTREQMQDWPEVTDVHDEFRRRFDAFVEGWVEQGAPQEMDREFAKLFDGLVNPRPRFAPNFILEHLKRVGSQAAPGFMRPEGICVYHKASGVVFKATVEKDQSHKGA